MKKLLTVSLLMGTVLLFGFGTQAQAMLTNDLAAFGSVVSPLPITPPTVEVLDDVTGALRTRASVDFAVLYDSSTSIYSYFYQIENLGGGTGDGLFRYTFTNPYGFSLLGNGIRSDGLNSVVQTGTGAASYFGANFNLSVTQKTNRFYFQFYGPPGIVSGSLINGGTENFRTVGPVPEPTSLLLLGSGLLGFALLGRARRRKRS